MTLIQILILVGVSLLAGWLLPTRWRNWFILSASIIGVYWLQPASPIRNLSFWLPTISVGLTIMVWTTIQFGQKVDRGNTLVVGLIIFGIILLLSANRYFGSLCCLTSVRPPQLSLVVLVIIFCVLFIIFCYRIKYKRLIAGGCLTFLIILFIFLKQEKISEQISAIVRLLNHQDPSMASSIDLQWIGFSYLAFRLLHVLRDFQSGKFLDYSLGEFLTYALFYPALPAGPIDRSQRFVEDLRKTDSLPKPVLIMLPDNLVSGLQRILWGVLKKFVFADSLALIALNPQNALQIKTPFWMWVALYAYSLRIFFDFSGYTDIAIGLGKLLGINLPENFLSPYFKSNLISFWNSWHITLAQWFRAYFFNPLTRMIRIKLKNTPTWLVILIGQFSMMILIGLWHGIKWNFVGWGLWHGAGLFINNRWSDWYRRHGFGFENSSFGYNALQISGCLVTFNFVTLGWVWFALPNLVIIQHVFFKLFGL